MSTRPSGHRAQRADRTARRRRLLSVVAVLVALAVLAGGVYGAIRLISGVVDNAGDSAQVADFAGNGERPLVVVDIPRGANSADIAVILAEAGVVASEEAFVSVATADPESVNIQFGSYRLPSRMSAASALQQLLDPSSFTTTGLEVRPGERADEVLRALSEETDTPVRQLRRVLAQRGSIGLPAPADGDPEGYLRPGSYPTEDESAVDLLTQMVAGTTTELDQLGWAASAERLGLTEYELLTAASIVQAEGRPQDMGKVGRVILNRLEQGITLGMDSTLHYYFGTRGDLQLTVDQLEDDNPYNTRIREGLPPTPISQPSDDALTAMADPPAGDWLYFVTVNGDTGETKFTDNYEEFLEFSREFDEWDARND